MKIKRETVLFNIAFIAIILFAAFSCCQKPVVPSYHTEWSENATIYEVNVRQFTPEGTFRAFEEHLPRLQKMGVKILWLMPVNPIGVVNRKGTLGSYYSVKDYLDVNPEFGTKEDFRHLVEKIHEMGMYIIIDWVANHTSWDNPLIMEHPEWFSKDTAGNIISPVPDWSDVADLDYTNPGLRDYMTNALAYWVQEFDIDGYRCDVAGMLPADFWDSAVPKIKKKKPLFMLAEWETPEMHDTAFDATYSWDLFQLMNQIAKGEKTANFIDSLLKKERQDYPPHAYRMRFTSNHDENTWNGTEFERMGNASEAFAVLTFTFPGIPLIYSGQEAALNKRLAFFDKDTISWNNYPLTEFYSTLCLLKQQNKLTSSVGEGSGFVKIPSTADTAVYAFIRSNPDNRLFVIINLSATDQTTVLQGDEFPGRYKNVFTRSEEVFDKGVTISLGRWDYRIYIAPIKP